MVIFELPRDGDRAGLRVASLGSCHVRNPFYLLANWRELRLCGAGLSATHTVAEALQAVDFITGATPIPQALNSYIFGVDEAPPTAQLARLLKGGVDVTLLEVLDDKQFTFGEVCLQQNFVATLLIQKHRGALLAWYRQVCLQGVADEATVEIALRKLRDGGYRHDDAMAELLRGVTLRRASIDEISADLAALRSRIDGRWVVIGAFDIPGEGGPIMADRRALNAKLEIAAKRCGADFYNPSLLIAEHGRERALQADGASIYEFAADFEPIVGKTLVSLARGRAPTENNTEPVKVEAGASVASLEGAALRRRLVESTNLELVDLHRQRVASLGVDGSGLYRHYHAFLERGELIGPRETGFFELICAYLPPYEAYAVLRGGLGELALLLAASGRKVITCEPHPLRRAAIEAGSDRLQAAGLMAPGMLTVLEAPPQAPPRAPGVLAVGLEALLAHGPEDGAPLMNAMQGYAALLIDLRLFLWVRETAAQQEEAVRDLALMGFDTRWEYGAAGLCWFRRSGAEAPR